MRSWGFELIQVFPALNSDPFPDGKCVFSSWVWWKNGRIVRHGCDCLPFGPPTSARTRLMSKTSIYNNPNPESCRSGWKLLDIQSFVLQFILSPGPCPLLRQHAGCNQHSSSGFVSPPPCKRRIEENNGKEYFPEVNRGDYLGECLFWHPLLFIC